ncbi:hypothetical protein I7I48_09005 [Histoplasma ohiense]|nr:hypothetical protein I7I48_09005 [Histoplasma ohiense (nom. inval.)]
MRNYDCLRFVLILHSPLLAANFRSSKKQPLYACPYMNDCETVSLTVIPSTCLCLILVCLFLYLLYIVSMPHSCILSHSFPIPFPFLSLMMFHLFTLLFSVPSARIPALSHFSFSSSFRLGRSTMAYYTTLLLLNTRF